MQVGELPPTPPARRSSCSRPPSAAQARRVVCAGPGEHALPMTSYARDRALAVPQVNAAPVTVQPVARNLDYRQRFQASHRRLPVAPGPQLRRTLPHRERAGGSAGQFRIWI